MSPYILSESTQGKLVRAPSALTLACRCGACGRASVVILRCVNAILRSLPLALAPASYGISRRCAAIVPRRAIVLVARRIGFLLHSE